MSYLTEFAKIKQNLLCSDTDSKPKGWSGLRYYSSRLEVVFQKCGVAAVVEKFTNLQISKNYFFVRIEVSHKLETSQAQVACYKLQVAG